MDSILEELISQLPPPEIELTASSIKDIQHLIPVPNDYEIIWADIISLGGYPAGVVITKQALIIKATKKDVKNKNDEIRSINKTIECRRRRTLSENRRRCLTWRDGGRTAEPVAKERAVLVASLPAKPCGALMLLPSIALSSPQVKAHSQVTSSSSASPTIRSSTMSLFVW